MSLLAAGMRRMQWRWRTAPFFARTPVVLQSEVAECGLACLVMVARHHGSRIDLEQARARLEVSPRGATLQHLVAMARQLGLEPRAVQAELADLHRLALPCVLHWDFEHFVVLTRVRGQAATLHDPATGRHTMPLGEVSRHFTGIALELEPSGDPPAAQAPDRRPADVVLPGLRAVRPLLPQLLALTALLQLALLLGPLQVQWLVDEALGARDAGWVRTLALAFGSLAVLQVVMAVLRGWLIAVVGARFNHAMFTHIVGRLLRLPMPWFQKRNVADVLSRLESIQTIQATLTTGLIETLVDSSLVLLSGVMMLRCSPPLAAIAGIAGLVHVGTRLLLYGPTRTATQQFIVRASRRSAHLIESVRGMQTVKLFGFEHQRIAAATHLAVEQANSQLLEDRLRLAGQAAGSLVFGLEAVATLSLGTWLVMGGAGAPDPMTLGALMAFLGYKLQFTQRLGTLMDKAFEIRLLGLHVERLGDIAAAPVEFEDLAAPQRPVERWDLEFAGVGFAYAAHERPVLAGAELRVAEGECVAIVGASGCGKSTVLKLMLGLVQPTCGEVRVGGRPLSQQDARAWRRCIGTVMQDDMLFSGTVAQNICFFDTRPDTAAIEDCARTVGFHDEVAAMPMGYATLVGDMGSTLSGGQKQRLLLARALYRKPRVLLLDEATSHLDVASEKRINEAVSALGITRVIVAHRPQTIASAQRVVELRDGVFHERRASHV